MMKKAKKIFIRIGFEDIIVPIENAEAVIKETSPQYCDHYILIGYEDEDGEECEEDGTYLNQNNNNIIEFYCEKYSNDTELGKAIRKFKYK
tara:strand:+ start:61 stop:333 length:273 start_codon:yes stop_codon:yes gene_type:complete